MRVDIIIVIIFAFCSLSLVRSTVTDLLLSPATTVVSEYKSFFGLPLDGVNDLVFTVDEGKRQALIMKRDIDGTYNVFASIPLNNISAATTTNGEWFGSISITGIELFRVDQSGQYYNYSFIGTGTLDKNFYARLLGDNSLAIAFPTYIVTYEYDNSKWVVINNSSFPGARFTLYGTSITSTQRDSLVFVSMIGAPTVVYNYYIITRQADKSWKISETIAGDATLFAQNLSFFWDGSSTLLAALNSYGSTSVLNVFNKINGLWIISQWFSSAELGVTQLGYFGKAPLVALDNNNVLVTAAADGVGSLADLVAGRGSVFLMQRNDKNEWNFIARFRSNSSTMGAGLAQNGQDALTLGCNTDGSNNIFCSLYTLPSCIISPIDATCPQQRDSCEVDLLTNIFAVNNPQCGQITTRYTRVVTHRNGTVVDGTLSRLFVPDVNCTLIQTCSELLPAPIEPPVQTPTIIVATPIASQTPTAVVKTPAQTPIAIIVTTPTDSTVSSGQVLVNSITSIVTVVAFVLM